MHTPIASREEKHWTSKVFKEAINEPICGSNRKKPKKIETSGKAGLYGDENVPNWIKKSTLTEAFLNV